MIILYGAGSLGSALVQQQFGAGRGDIAFVDSDEELWNQKVEGIPVLEPTVANLSDANHVVIATMWVREVYEQLRVLGISHTQIWVPEVSMFNQMRGLFTPRVEEVALNLTEATFAVLEDSGLIVYIDYGTLLGLWRDGGLIRWDSDIDLTVVGESTSEHELVADIVANCAKTLGIAASVSSLANSSVVAVMIESMCVPISIDQAVVQNGKIYNRQNPHFPAVDVETVMALGRLPSRPNIRVPKEVPHYLEQRYGASWQVPTRQWAYRYGAHDLNLQVLTHLDQLN